MYAVIRAGGKQYRVAPGDVIRIEKQARQDAKSGAGTLEFSDVLAVSSEEGKVARPDGNARVSGRIVERGRADKILVFHFKRKKQYKKLVGHRQPFTAVRITEIAFDGKSFKAAQELAAKPAKKKDVVKSAAEIAGAAAGIAAGAADAVSAPARQTKPAEKAAARKGTPKAAAKKSPRKPGGGKGKK